ncbi:hypothetical protein ACFO9Q_17315 [Paenibacillus sp. GCM10023252]|uniref:hypothetical protein n=1 Tax=Paenibacillus sp. GCM10023252 TaxID=3252649 RepID=UPI00360C2B1B
MRKSKWKWALLGGALVIIIMYGIELTTTGIERVYGPLADNEAAPVAIVQDEEAGLIPQKEESPQSELEQKVEELEQELQRVKQLAAMEDTAPVQNGNEHLPGIPREVYEPAVNKVADSTAGLLQSVSSGGIRFIVSLFDSVTE